MNIGEFNPSTFKPTIVKTGPISSDELRAFSEATVNDLASLSVLINSKIVQILKTLPETPKQNAIENGFDGKSIYVDNNAANDVDNGLFYHIDEQRPMSIYESMLLIVQILANIENGLREGVAIGSISDPIAIANTETVEYEWPYFDGAFEVKLFSDDGSGIITDASNLLNISVDYINKKILLNNTSGDTVTVYGFLWHPVFSF